MAVNGQVVIRPMMCVALSYDHRIVDGRRECWVLVKVKENARKSDTDVFGGKKSGRDFTWSLMGIYSLYFRIGMVVVLQ